MSDTYRYEGFFLAARVSQDKLNTLKEKTDGNKKCVLPNNWQFI